MLELLVAAVLILLNGVFALSELAVVSSRPARLRAMARAGRPGAAVALRLMEHPGRFLSTVQIGITLVGILAGAFSGAALGGRLALFLEGLGLADEAAAPLGYGIVIALITYLSVIVGELVPKQLALRNAEAIAAAVAPGMALLSRVAGPAVWLLDASTRAVFRLFGGPRPAQTVTDEEIRALVAEAETSGTLDAAERQMIAGVLRLGERGVRGLMTPRTEIERIDVGADGAALRQALRRSRHSILPVTEGSADDVIGVVRLRDLVDDLLAGTPLSLRAHLREPIRLPDTIDALEAVERLRAADLPFALIHDEYGHFEGVVTPADMLETIVGAFGSDDAAAEPDATRREDGSWLLAGSMPADEMADLLGLTLPEGRDYETVAGFVVDRLRHLPATGEWVEMGGWRFEVVDLDGRRVDKVLAGRPPASDTV